VTTSAEVSFLQDGAQRAERVAKELADFFSAAQRSLDIAIYDINLRDQPADQVRSAVRAAAGRGVAIRLLYNVDFPNPIPVPPPSQADMSFIESLGILSKPVPGIPSLMHHKYIVRDAGTDAATVWTGSTNWTNDSWTREENVIVRLPAAALAAEYARNFDELWTSGRVDGTGKYDLAGVPVPFDGGPIKAHVFFAPGRGRQMAHVIANRISHAKRRIRVCSPVITAGVVLGTLGDLLHSSHPDFKGVYDRTQMAEVLRQWRVDPHAGWKGPAFQAVSTGLPFASKVTTPYSPTSVHDYMHAKIVVVDNTVLTGSYNLSHAGEENAENLLELDSAPLADRFVTYVDAVFARYAPTAAAAPQ
jgi:phosphatidylserine/phosphatidylglycerophosphate/cardiolipin synthase-like enzyme